MVKCIDEDNVKGFVWHTTGNGKTHTSFKASTLLKENDHIHKCVFVVDRKDLDRQTREEFKLFYRKGKSGWGKCSSPCKQPGKDNFEPAIEIKTSRLSQQAIT